MSDEAEKAANLIAAAPELYDALKLCVKELQHRHTARVITSDEAEALRQGKAILDKLGGAG